MSDLISRQAAIDVLAIGEELLRRVLDEVDVIGHEREKYEWGLGLVESYISDMEELPSVTPQEPKSEWQQDHEILKAYSDGANEVLDKIRAEIERLQKMCDKNDLNLMAQYSAFGMVLDILDKYKAESEDKE